MKERIRFIALVGASAAFAWLLVRVFQFSVFDAARVTNESMLPQLKPGQMVLINKLSPCLKLPFSGYRFACSPCEIGRAYMFSHPTRPGQKLVKFAVAPASPSKRDIIWFTQGKAVAAQSGSAAASCYFEGSNREYSIDSRHFGPVALANIDGAIIYPHVRWLKTND